MRQLTTITILPEAPSTFCKIDQMLYHRDLTDVYMHSPLGVEPLRSREYISVKHLCYNILILG